MSVESYSTVLSPFCVQVSEQFTDCIIKNVIVGNGIMSFMLILTNVFLLSQVSVDLRVPESVKQVTEVKGCNRRVSVSPVGD